MSGFINWGIQTAKYWLWGAESSSNLPVSEMSADELIMQLRGINSHEDSSAHTRSSELLKGKTFALLQNAIFALVNNVNDRIDLIVLGLLLNYVETHHKFLITAEKSNIEALLEELESKVFRMDRLKYKAEIMAMLSIKKSNQPFNVDDELADREFCVKLERSERLDEVLALATPFQIKSALVYFSLKKSDFHQREQFSSIMVPLIQCARSRKINLDFTDGTFSLLTLICQRIPADRCSKGQLQVVELLLEGDANPAARVEEKAPHILPTMNLEVHRLFMRTRRAGTPPALCWWMKARY